MTNSLRVMLLAAATAIAAGCNAGGDSGATSVATGADLQTAPPLENAIASTEPAASTTDASTKAPDYAEATHLVFMREEEKLARDIYLTFSQWYPNQTTFKNITDSEQKHTDVMRDTLALFAIPDPNPDTNNLPASIGVFTGQEYGEYLTAAFEQLTTRGAQSELAALYVGALIEELDMHDIVKCPDEIVEQDNGIDEDGCGLDYTDEPAIITAYGSLLDGSKNHLRAFVKQIEATIGEGKYEAQFLSQDDVDEILGR